MSVDYYDKNGQPLNDSLEWARLFEDAEYQIVRQTTVGDTKVSTVWLGLDHSFGVGHPLIFETMLFGGERDQEQYRYATLEQAIAGHERLVGELG